MTLFAGLVVLALIDSTSVGTLLIPLWMLIEPRLRVGRFLLYLGTVTAFYFVVGVVLTLFAGTLREAVGDLDALSWAELVLGGVLFALSFVFEPKRVRRRRGDVTLASRWQARLSTAEGSRSAMVGLGLTAAGIEVMSMLPYLAAVGLITAAGLSVVSWLPVLAGYVLVMVLPALVLLGVRTALGTRVEEPLQVLSAWLSRHAEGVLGWVLAIAGFLLVRDAVVKLELIG
ncbi:GAP family protein [Actinoplanes sp. NPDC051494]|uniref:GAP family protein n=1 Tax=Actinoplanes sp. NPDC051494 TaxID=3363907 RepID=UPI0037A78752